VFALPAPRYHAHPGRSETAVISAVTIGIANRLNSASRLIGRASVAGYSNGGVFALWADLLHPETFSEAIVMSPGMAFIEDNRTVIVEFESQTGYRTQAAKVSI
jgi:enterochelin esterase-like enzyme